MAVSRTWEIPCETEAPHGPLDYSCSGGASRFRRPLLLLFVSVLRGRFAAVKRIHVKVALARRVTRKGASVYYLCLAPPPLSFVGVSLAQYRVEGPLRGVAEFSTCFATFRRSSLGVFVLFLLRAGSVANMMPIMNCSAIHGISVFQPLRARE